MLSSNSSKIKRASAGLMGLLLLVIVPLSAFYIAAEADHDCCGEDCQICACIAQCEYTLHGFYGGLAVLTVAVIPLILAMFVAASHSAAAFTDTLVSKKVRLNN